MKKLIAGFAFVAAASVGYADSLGGGGISNPAWIYLPSEGVISNNNEVGASKDYVLNVQVRDAAKRTLTIGNGTAGSAYHVFGTDENKLPVGGRILDLSEIIADEDGNQWTIEEFSFDCWRYFYENRKSTYAPFYEIILPRELKVSSGQMLNFSAHGLERVVLDCPELEGTIPDWAMTDTKSDGFTVNLPSLKSLGHISFKVGNTDVSDWNLSGLESISGKPFGYANYSGVLNLPSMRSMKANLSSSSRFSRVLLGTKHLTLETVGDKAFSYNDGWHYVNEFVLGGAPGWTIGSEAFTMFGLNRVWMVGSVPNFVDSKVAFGTNHVEKSIVFYVPDTEEWSAIRESAKKLTAEEISEFKKAHAEWDVPFGIVAADVFHTEKPQYIGTVDPSEFGVMCKVSIGSRSARQYGDVCTVSVDGEVVSDGFVLQGSDVTVTAIPSKESTIVSWEGELPDGTVPTGNTFTFKATKDASIYACFAHAWTYDAAASTISDGYWTLSVTTSSPSLLTIKGLTDESKKLKGELNLSGIVYGSAEEGETRWTISALGDKAFNSVANITSFYTPTVGFSSWGSQVFHYASAITNLVIDLPDYKKEIFPWGQELNNAPIERLVINAPATKRIGVNDDVILPVLPSATMADSDLSEWDLSNVVYVMRKGLQAGASNGVGPKGDLVLPNVETLRESAFYNWKRVTSAALGTNGTLKALGAYLFQNNTDSLKKVDFGTSSDFTTETTTFLANETTPLPIEEVWFAGKAPSVEALDNILALREVAADGSKPVKIFAPMMEKSWRAVCKPFTTEEAAQAYKMKADGLRVIGVYQTQDGRRVAWLVQNPGFPYYSGFRIIIR